MKLKIKLADGLNLLKPSKLHYKLAGGDKGLTWGEARENGNAQRLFPRETGLSVEAWRQKARLVHAAVRLAQGEPVTQVGLDCGWQSAAAFIAVFRQAFGVTPGRYARG